MKATLVTLWCIVFSIYANSLLGVTAEEADPVLDIAGKKLQVGINYYILPVICGRGGGIMQESSSNETCPLFVVQEELEVESGLPVTFKPVTSRNSVFPLSTDLNIKFSAPSICVQSTLWTLDQSGKHLITTGGVKRNPGVMTISNWFKVEKYDND